MGGVFFDLLVCVGLFSSKLKRTHLNRRDKNGVLQEEVQMTAKHLPTGRTKPHMDGRCPLLEACGMTYLQSQGFGPENGGESTPILCPQSLPQWDPELHSEATRRGEELHPQRELVCLHKDAVLKGHLGRTRLAWAWGFSSKKCETGFLQFKAVSQWQVLGMSYIHSGLLKSC